VDPGAHPVGGSELAHPHEHEDAQLLRPAEIEREEALLHARDAQARGVAVQHRGEDDERGRAHEEGDDAFLQAVEDLHNLSGSKPVAL
jgi:hypothetical protein